MLFYSVQNGSFVQDVDAVSQYFPNQDTMLCWAAAASNILTYMKNQAGLGIDYSSTHSLSTGNTTVDSLVHGVSQYSIYETFSNSFRDQGGQIENAIAWYSAGIDLYNNIPLKNGATGGFYSSQVGNTKTDFLSNVLVTNFQTYGPRYVGNYILNDIVSGSTSYTQLFQESIQNSPLGLSIAEQKEGQWVNGHAITCWGFETDASGAVTLLYITDSDDATTTLKTIGVTQNADGRLALSGGSTQWDVYDALGQRIATGTTGNYDSYYLTGISSYQNFFLMAPEPSTATLSLLGLAALAIRRKRA